MSSAPARVSPMEAAFTTERSAESATPRALRSDTLRVLGVGLDRDTARRLRRWGEGGGFAVTCARAAKDGLTRAISGNWDVVLVRLERAPEEELAGWIERRRRVASRPRVVALAGNPTVRLALRAVRMGVPDLLPLPLRREDLQPVLRRVRRAVEEVPIPLPPTDVQRIGGVEIVGRSPAMSEVYRKIARVGPAMTTVLLQGESGTGKELVARAIHVHGPRAAGPFIAFNCAAIPENLLESELFGHERDAFTGALGRKIGRFERAKGGTLFLDEVADMSLALQGKILRAIQERQIERVGGRETIEVDARIIAATNRNLREVVSAGGFREDLYYRLAVVTIQLPGLVERGDDLLQLTSHFVRQLASRSGKEIRCLTDGAVEHLRERDWPGNVRELRNVIERAVLYVEGDTLRVEHLRESDRVADSGSSSSAVGGAPFAPLREVEIRHVAGVLAHTGGQVTEAAAILGIHRNTLARKIREYGL